MTTKFVELAQTKDASSFRDAFETAVAEKAFDALESRKADVARAMFNPESIEETKAFGKKPGYFSDQEWADHKKYSGKKPKNPKPVKGSHDDRIDAGSGHGGGGVGY